MPTQARYRNAMICLVSINVGEGRVEEIYTFASNETLAPGREPNHDNTYFGVIGLNKDAVSLMMKMEAIDSVGIKRELVSMQTANRNGKRNRWRHNDSSIWV